MSVALAHLVEHPDRIGDVDPADVPVLLGQLAEMQARLHARMVSALAAPAPPTTDRLLKAKAAAAMLGMSEGYLYDHADTFDFTRRQGRSVRFSEQGMQAWLRGERGGRSIAQRVPQKRSRL